MAGVLTGYGIIFVIIAVGYFITRIGLVSQDLQPMVNKLTYYVCTPALLFTVLVKADVSVMFSGQIVIAALVFFAAIAVYLFVAIVFLKQKKLMPLMFGAASSAWVNSNNIGLPVAIYMLGSATWVAPILLLQLAVLTPVFATLLGAVEGGKFSLVAALKQPLTNPMVVSSIVGLIIAMLGWEVPEPVLAPFDIIGGAAIPLILMGFGMSLRGRHPFSGGSPVAEIVTASVIKVAVMPVLAWLIGAFVLGLNGIELYAAVVIAALPTAQNMYLFAVEHNNSVMLTRDTALVTTVASFPALLLIALFLL